MMKWKVDWLPEALKDLDDLDNSIRIKVLKAALKLEMDPINYGEPLGNKMGLELTGFYKKRVADGYRIVYFVKEQQVYVAAVAVGKRTRSEVYKSALQRINEHRADTNEELKKLMALIKK